MGTAVVPRKSKHQYAPVTEELRERIIVMLLSGEFPTDAEIAKAVNVRPSYITTILKCDPELAERRKEANLLMAQMIEKSAVELAISGRNEMAKERAHEFLLKKLYPDKYGDAAEAGNTEKGSRKVIINLKMPVMKTDKNGFPVAQSANPLMDAIDVK